jgi:hypothetical protein
MPIPNVKRETAARMIAEDREPDYLIAAAVGVSLRTIQYWKKRPDVKARIQEIANQTAIRLAAQYEHFERLREREICRMHLSGNNLPVKLTALARLREIDAL